MLAIALALAAAASRAADFARYAAPVSAVRPVVRIRTTTPWTRRYRSDLAEEARRPVDFAGHYVLAVIGCGAECLTIGAIDRLTGKVVELKRTVCCWPDDVLEPLAHRADSRLLVVQGRLNEVGPAGVHRFVLRRGAFQALPDPPPPAGPR